MSTITLSVHARNRLRERHDRHLIPYTNEREFNLSCYELFDSAVFSKRHINDTRFMINIQEKYGYNKIFRFKLLKNVLFVIVDCTCVTVLDTDIHESTNQHVQPKKY